MAKKKSIPPWARIDESDKGFVAFYLGMLRSSAWISLSVNARVIYFAMRMKYGPQNGFADTIRISYSEISRMARVRRGSVRKHIEELEDAGFIRIEEQGMKTVNEYRFISDWKEKDNSSES